MSSTTFSKQNFERISYLS